MNRIITMENVCWRRSGVEILKNIHWTVNRDEHWAILGLNGSGKTSVLNIVTGYNYPTSGRVKVLDTEFGKASIPDLRKRIGYVSSSLGRFAEFSIQHLDRSEEHTSELQSRFEIVCRLLLEQLHST